MLLNYRELGTQGPVLVVLHGLFGSLDNWVTIGNKLAERHRVVLVDLRNHGRSPHYPSHSYDEMADDLHQLIEHLNLRDFHLVGHSMGGKVAMTYAHTHQQGIKSLVIVDIGPKAYPVHHELIIRALQSIHLTKITTRKQAEEELAHLIDENDTRQFLLKNLYRNKLEDGTERFVWRFNLEVIANEIQEVGIPQPWPCHLPTLFVRGSRSGYVTDADLPAIKKLYPNSSCVTLNAGHWVHAEDPNGLFAALMDHLAEVACLN